MVKGQVSCLTKGETVAPGRQAESPAEICMCGESPFLTARQRHPPHPASSPLQVRALKGPAALLSYLARLLLGASDPAPTCQQEVVRWHSSLGIVKGLREQGLSLIHI